MSLLALGGAGLAAAAAFSARWNWWRPRASGLAVPMYHHIGTPPRGTRHAKLWVRPEDFRAQLKHLLSEGWTPMLFSELAAALEGSSPMPEKPALITFDDGTADNFELAFPLLREAGVKANFFVVFEGIGGHTWWENPAEKPFLRMLTWEQIEAMRDSALAEFGSHTMRHPDLAALRPVDARWEIEESKRRLEQRLGRPVVAFAYPFGSGARSAPLRAAVLGAGYRLDFSVRQGLNPLPLRREDDALRRLLIRGDDTAYDFELNLTRGKARL